MCRSSARSKARRSSRSCPSKTADLQENPPRLRVTWSDAEPCHIQALFPAPVDPRPPRTGAGGPGFPVTNRLHDLPGREDSHPGWPDAVGLIHRCSTCPCLARGPFCRRGTPPTQDVQNLQKLLEFRPFAGAGRWPGRANTGDGADSSTNSRDSQQVIHVATAGGCFLPALPEMSLILLSHPE